MYRARLIIINGRFGFISNRRMKKKNPRGMRGEDEDGREEGGKKRKKGREETQKKLFTFPETWTKLL